MSNKDSIKNILGARFDKRKVDSLIDHFCAAIQNFEEGKWEYSLVKSGKFVEVAIKLLWAFAGNPIPRERKFRAGLYSQKIIDQTDSSVIHSDGVRLQVPRACIFLYDITSNRGGRHDSDEFDPNEMDAITASALCSWILAELVRFCASSVMSPNEAHEIVDSVIERRYPIFEEIDGRIYIDNEKYKSAPQCALMILYKKYPNRMSKNELVEAVVRHNYKKTAMKLERLSPYIDIDRDGGILLRSNGRQKVDEMLSK